MPEVSVIIPSYNSADYIADTLESVQKQTLTSWEAIVIDDHSTDGTSNIVKKIAQVDNRIRLIELRENSGRPAVPRNIGVGKANGKFIAFLDSDDMWHRQKLELQIATMSRFNIPFSSARTMQFTFTDALLQEKKQEYADISSIRTSRLTHDKLILKNTICNSSVVLTRELALASPFIEDIRYKAIEDFHCWLTIHQHYDLSSIVLEAPLTFYRIAISSISRSKYFMFQRNRILYSEYEVNSRKLGLKRYFYLGTYIYYSLMQRLIGPNYRP